MTQTVKVEAQAVQRGSKIKLGARWFEVTAVETDPLPGETTPFLTTIFFWTESFTMKSISVHKRTLITIN